MKKLFVIIMLAVLLLFCAAAPALSLNPAPTVAAAADADAADTDTAADNAADAAVEESGAEQNVLIRGLAGLAGAMLGIGTLMLVDRITAKKRRKLLPKRELKK